MVQPRTPKKARGGSDCPASFPRRSTEAGICELRREHPRVGTPHLLPLSDRGTLLTLDQTEYVLEITGSPSANLGHRA